MSSPMLAANAYQRLSALTDASSGAMPGIGGASKPGAGGGFGAMLEQVIGSVSEAGKNADTQTMKAVQGRGDLVDVVTAVAESETALETLVSVRDRVISAYEEIMRMPI
jgi:flagellar hook-basal body complex protein FliE